MTGRFQWAVCQLNVLCSCRSVLQLRKALGSLPETLYKTYDRILCKINKEDSQFAFKILQWLAFCVRPLRLREVAEVIAIDVTETPRFDPQKRFRDLRDILEICSSLISLDFIGESASDTKINTITGGDILTAAYDYTNEFDDTDIDTANGPWSKATISLAHFSVKEYLVSDRIWRGPASAYGLQELKCNERIAEDCLGYLLHLISPEISKSTALEDYPSPKKPTNYLSMTIEEYPLAQYAAKYWFEHYGLIERTESTALALVQELFLSKIEAFMNWLGLFDPDRTWLGLFDTDRPWWARPWTMGYRTGAPLYYASLLGLSESVALLIENGADVNAQGGWREYALKAASSSGHIEIVQLLLDRGADLDAHSGESIITALEGASCYGHIEIVQLLLDKGAHITTRGGHSPLTTALMRGHECIAHLLINKGAYLGTVSSRNVTTPLETAISYGSKSSVQLMLDKGADINIDATGSSNPLDSACFFGHEDIVQLLLDRGAVVNPQSLVATLAYGKTRILQMLLEHGGDLNQKDINGEAVCHYAASRGDVKVFELLASSGVDLTVTDKQGRNCLHVTSGYGYQDPIALLLRLGLDPNSIDHNGWTPLHWAARRGDVKTIVMLEDAGAVFSVETINGWTPDDVATFYGHKFNWKSTNTTVHHVSRGVDHKAGCAGCHKVREPPNRMLV